MELLIFILITFGITNILIDSYIFIFLRNFANKYSPKFFGELLSCPMCTGFWIGIFVGLTGYDTLFFEDILPHNWIIKYPLTWLFLGAIGSGTSYLIYNIVDYFITDEVVEEQEIQNPDITLPEEIDDLDKLISYMDSEFSIKLIKNPQSREILND